MQNIKKPRSIKVIYWITNVMFWIYSAVSILLLALVVGLVFGVFDDLQLHVGIPVTANILEQGTLDLNIVSTFINVEFVDMTGSIHFIDTPHKVGCVYGVFILIVTSIMFYIFLTVKRFVSNVYDGRYFDFHNILLLKRISYALLVGWVFTAFYAYFQYFFIVSNLQFETIEFTGNVQTYPITLLFALIIWVLSHIFMKGCELQEENKLTV